MQVHLRLIIKVNSKTYSCQGKFLENVCSLPPLCCIMEGIDLAKKMQAFMILFNLMFE